MLEIVKISNQLLYHFSSNIPYKPKNIGTIQVFSQVLEDARATMTTMEHVNQLKERMGFTLAPRTISQTGGCFVRLDLPLVEEKVRST